MVVRAEPAVTMWLHIPGPLPALNDLFDLRMRGARRANHEGKRSNGYSDAKRYWASVVQGLVLQRRLTPIGPSAFTWVWFELDKLRDPDGLTAGGRKLALDALKTAGIIAGDGWRHVLDCRDHWVVAPQRVGVTVIAADRVLEREEAMAHVMATSTATYAQPVAPDLARFLKAQARGR